MKDFEITHFSVRYPWDKSDPPEHPYFVHNVVWRAHDEEFKQFCLGWCEEWRRTQVVFDRELAREYLDGLDIHVSELKSQFGGYPVEIVQREGIRRDVVFHDAWEQQFPFVVHIEKFDCFRHWGYTESNAITQAAVQEIRALQQSERMYRGRFATWCHFRRIITLLDNFWD